MAKAGGRRIKRNLLIDINSIHFYTKEDIEHLKEVAVLKDYLNKKTLEIDMYNEEIMEKNAGQHIINERHLTNIGTFRAYINHYLANHPFVRGDYTLLVRQLESEGGGLPIQIYCFTNDTRWVSYENIQSDIFDHLYAVMPEFGLKGYQKPTGGDFVKAIDSLDK